MPATRQCAGWRGRRHTGAGEDLPLHRAGRADGARSAPPACSACRQRRRRTLPVSLRRRRPASTNGRAQAPTSMCSTPALLRARRHGGPARRVRGGCGDKRARRESRFPRGVCHPPAQDGAHGAPRRELRDSPHRPQAGAGLFFCPDAGPGRRADSSFHGIRPVGHRNRGDPDDTGRGRVSRLQQSWSDADATGRIDEHPVRCGCGVAEPPHRSRQLGELPDPPANALAARSRIIVDERPGRRPDTAAGASVTVQHRSGHLIEDGEPDF